MKRECPTPRPQTLFAGIWSETAESVPFHSVIFPLTSFPILPSYICTCLPSDNIHIENPTRCCSVSTFYFIFTWSSTCFGRHTAHHQEPETALAASGFAYVEGCWTCGCSLWFCIHGRLLDVWLLLQQQPHVQQPSTYAKPEAASAVLGSWWWAVCRPKHVELHVNMK